MPTLDEIQRQVESLDGASIFLARKEIKELPKILWESEFIVQIIQGIYNGRNGVLVATDRRLIFLDKGFLFGLKVEDFPYDKITSIKYELGILMGEITIFCSGNRAEIGYVEKDKARIFAESVRARISSQSSQVGTVSHRRLDSSLSSDDAISKLERLASLKSSGIITEEEFIEQKRRILNS